MSIHPPSVAALVRCACGNEMRIRSTQPGFIVEVCSRCHPAYTGVRKPVNVEGRIERFRRRSQRPQNQNNT